MPKKCQKKHISSKPLHLLKKDNTERSLLKLTWCETKRVGNVFVVSSSRL